MKDYLISMFIDNELNMDEKILFVEAVHGDRPFKDETVSLIGQEKMLRADMVTRVPAVQIGAAKTFALHWFRPLAAFSAALALAAALFFLYPRPANRDTTIAAQRVMPYRFVVYLPHARRAQIVGSFTDWRPLPMRKLAQSGYWVLTLNLSAGEYRYSYLVDRSKHIADPTIATREKDDFGGENSIIEVKNAA